MSVALRFSISALARVNNQTKELSQLLCSSKILPVIFMNQDRKSSFFNQYDADDLWGSVRGLSNVGRKRGRGRGKMRRINLHKGQVIGEGKAGMEWPGLTSDAIKGNQIMKMTQHGPKQEYFDNIIQMRSQKPVSTFKTKKLPDLLRGWSGNNVGGQKIDPPDPIGDFKFEGFESRILELKKVANVSGIVKKVTNYSCLVVVGNKNGIGGFAIGKSKSKGVAMKKATNKAAQHLQHVERFEGHTIYHNMFTKQTGNKIYLYRKEEGYGLVCHRCIKTICDVIGIKNLYAKCEGSTNILNMTKAFFQALREQETHQELANRKKLHVVELRKELDYLPIIAASPNDGEVSKEELPRENNNFETMYFDGKVQLNIKKQPFYKRFQGYKNAEKWKNKNRYQRVARQERILYGIEPVQVTPKKEDAE